jgi:hypothetical protein
MRNPIQPVVVAEGGVVRFKKNLLVNALVEHGAKTGLGLNQLAVRFSAPEHADDRRQLAQLIGYSLSGFADLSYADDETCIAAELMRQGKSEVQARIEALETKLELVRGGMRDVVATLFEIHPDDLDGG